MPRNESDEQDQDVDAEGGDDYWDGSEDAEDGNEDTEDGEGDEDAEDGEGEEDGEDGEGDLAVDQVLTPSAVLSSPVSMELIQSYWGRCVFKN